MDVALLVLRVVVGPLVAAHGAQKLFGWFGGGGLQKTARLLEQLGLRPPLGWAAAGALAEFGGGLLLALGLLAPLGSVGVGAAMAIAVTKIHWPKLWVTQHGYEYPLVILAVAVAVGLAGSGAYSLDALWGTALPPSLRDLVLALGALGYLAAMCISALHNTAGPKAHPAN